MIIFVCFVAMFVCGCDGVERSRISTNVEWHGQLGPYTSNSQTQTTIDTETVRQGGKTVSNSHQETTTISGPPIYLVPQPVPVYYPSTHINLNGGWGFGGNRYYSGNGRGWNSHRNSYQPRTAPAVFGDGGSGGNYQQPRQDHSQQCRPQNQPRLRQTSNRHNSR